jgi:aminoacylase
MMEFREEQRKDLAANCGCGKQLGDYTTINLTMLHAGDHSTIQYNVIPSLAEAGFDCRIPATVDLKAFKAVVDGWCGEDGVSYELVNGTDQGALDNPTTSIAPDSYWWSLFSKACETAGAPLLEPSIFPAATDGRWIRMMLGTPCFGFSPMRRTPILLHDHDEFIPVDVFLEGVRIYEKLIPQLASADKEPEVSWPKCFSAE